MEGARAVLRRADVSDAVFWEVFFVGADGDPVAARDWVPACGHSIVYDASRGDPGWGAPEATRACDFLKLEALARAWLATVAGEGREILTAELSALDERLSPRAEQLLTLALIGEKCKGGPSKRVAAADKETFTTWLRAHDWVVVDRFSSKGKKAVRKQFENAYGEALPPLIDTIFRDDDYVGETLKNWYKEVRPGPLKAGRPRKPKVIG